MTAFSSNPKIVLYISITVELISPNFPMFFSCAFILKNKLYDEYTPFLSKKITPVSANNIIIILTILIPICFPLNLLNFIFLCMQIININGMISKIILPIFCMMYC